MVIGRPRRILDLGNMNKALVAKWIFSYANNKDVIWRKVACALTKGDPNSLMLTFGNSENKSMLLGFLDAAIGRNG